ncbi:SIP domain-containing protein [Nocardiopsis composta]|uniref:NADPH-dependent ferric siderophore reductase n=1 Tax=Nocardiopsis composta TaxID=157465 RepID=A0A7W8QTF4_9ACTN|nr:SIP domain-containing protein [Nocardiopsis composta]MBB5436126.1 NADPH-dependent ferric siderophore reductase [Nocardiopsis composta]
MARGEEPAEVRKGPVPATRRSGPAPARSVRRPGADRSPPSGEETVLPAIPVQPEEPPAGHRALVFVEVADAAEEQSPASRAGAEVHRPHRNGRPPGERAAVLSPPAGRGRSRGAAERGTVRTLRRRFVQELGTPAPDTRLTAYGTRGPPQDEEV